MAKREVINVEGNHDLMQLFEKSLPEPELPAKLVVLNVKDIGGANYVMKNK